MAKKSAAGAIEDFFIKLGFDASAVKKGFKEIETEFNKLNKTYSSA